MLTLQEISDRIEIDDLLTRYARAVDTLDWPLLDTVFTPDAVVDYTASGGIRGTYPEIRAWLAKVLPLFPVRQHFVTNRDVQIAGDSATSRAMLFNPMGTRNQADGVDLFYIGGCYVDRLVRTPAGWRIAERREEQAWTDRPVRPPSG
jgi:3-phenylpropionate/cinnamic acid dioxygenase small subunit